MTETPPPPYEQQQPAPGQQAPGTYYQQPAAEDPGKTLGIVGLILSFFTALIGLIVSAVALNKSKKAGFKNTPALIGIIIGAIGTVFAVIAISLAIAGSGRPRAALRRARPGRSPIGRRHHHLRPLIVSFIRLRAVSR